MSVRGIIPISREEINARKVAMLAPFQQIAWPRYAYFVISQNEICYMLTNIECPPTDTTGVTSECRNDAQLRWMMDCNCSYGTWSSLTNLDNMAIAKPGKSSLYCPRHTCNSSIDTLGILSGINKPLSFAKPIITTSRKDIWLCCPRVELYVTDAMLVWYGLIYLNWCNDY